MWYDALHYLKDYIANSMNGRVVIGNLQPNMLGISESEYGVVMLYRGNENYDKDNTYIHTLYLETWVRDDSKDLEQGYKKLANLEADLDKAIQHLSSEVTKLNEELSWVSDYLQLLDIWIDKKQGDLDAIRPLVGSQYTIKLRLYLHEED